MTKLKQQNTMKHLMNFTSKQASRPILQGIHFSQDGSITATNSHILIQLKNYHNQDVSYTMNPKTLREYDQQYPNVERLIPTMWDQTFTLTQNEYDQIISFVKATNKKEVITMKVTNNEIQLINIYSTYNIKLTNECNCDFKMLFNVDYLKASINTLKDLTSEVAVLYNGSIKPLAFINDDLSIIITPLRPKN